MGSSSPQHLTLEIPILQLLTCNKESNQVQTEGWVFSRGPGIDILPNLMTGLVGEKDKQLVSSRRSIKPSLIYRRLLYQVYCTYLVIHKMQEPTIVFPAPFLSLVQAGTVSIPFIISPPCQDFYSLRKEVWKPLTIYHILYLLYFFRFCAVFMFTAWPGLLIDTWRMKWELDE